MQRRACENDISPNLPQLSTIQMQTLICSQCPWQRGVSVKGLLRLQRTPPIISPLQYGEIAIGLHMMRAQHGSCFIVFAGSRIQIPKVIKKKTPLPCAATKATCMSPNMCCLLCMQIHPSIESLEPCTLPALTQFSYPPPRAFMSHLEHSHDSSSSSGSQESGGRSREPHRCSRTGWNCCRGGRGSGRAVTLGTTSGGTYG